MGRGKVFNDEEKSQIKRTSRVNFPGRYRKEDQPPFRDSEKVCKWSHEEEEDPFWQWRYEIRFPAGFTSTKNKFTKKTGAISKRIYQASGLTGIAKTTRNRILGMIEKHKAIQRRPPRTSRHKDFRLNWARKYMKSDMKCVLFTGETRATLDGPDGWAIGWVINGEQASLLKTSARTWKCDDLGRYYRCWSITCSSRYKTYICYILSVCEERTWPMVEEVSLSRLKQVVYMPDNAPSHPGKCNNSIPGEQGWTPNSPDINPIDNLWAIVKQKIYDDGKQFSTLDDLWKLLNKNLMLFRGHL